MNARRAFTLIELPCHADLSCHSLTSAEASAKAGPPTHYSRLPAVARFTSARSPTSDLRRLTSGFTLIELLIVIIMIAILASLLYPAINGAQNQAKRVQAKNDVTQIVSAVNAFYTEYGKYPTSATTDTIYGPGGSQANNVLFNELRGTSSTFNTRQIVFISPPNVKDPNNPRAGIASANTNVNGISVKTNDFVDPWGTPYNVEVDADYTSQIETNPYPDSDGSAGPTPLRQGVISWSYGADQQKGSPANSNKYKNSDDVISWQ